ncbi:MAG: PqqD family protein [Candidatus Omnitrophica bacterium]|nr:PqqD family protein [Candidatus Omnitrophota bacterium]
MFRLTDIFEKNGRIPWRRVEEEAILVDQDEGDLLKLTPVGAAIWEALDGSRTVQELITHIEQNFEAEPKRVKHDVLSFLKKLRREGLIEPKHFAGAEKGE